MFLVATLFLRRRKQEALLFIPRNHGSRSPKTWEEAQGCTVRRISLSGVLNFDDGLWSSCVGDRLIVLTTNHLDRLDPALLRPGRKDRKIEFGYCKGPALRVLAKNYLGDCGTPGDGDHKPTDGDHRYEELMIGVAERLLAGGGAHLTPADDVAEVFMGCDGDGALAAALRKLVDDLNSKSVVPECAATATSHT